MLKLFVRLAVAGLLANAAFRVGSEYLTYVRFRDAIREAAMYQAKADEDLHRRIMELSLDYDVPLSEDALTMQRHDRHVAIQGSYRKPIEVLPSFSYPWPFTWSMDVMISTTAPIWPKR